MSTLGVIGNFSSQPDALDLWREVERHEELCTVKGDPIPWVVQIVKN
jgi:hypothetical protein